MLRIFDSLCFYFNVILLQVLHFLDKHTYEDLRLLHKLCFNSYGRVSRKGQNSMEEPAFDFRIFHLKKFEVKKNIKQFSGFDFDIASPELTKKKDVLNK
jgi:hypothetical protein